MKRNSRILIAVLSLAMLAVYFLPIWKIGLQAPQYPEGLSMSIDIHTITGNVAIINDLNHYIGMKYIRPDSIPELKWMPYVLALLILTGLAVALLGKRRLFGIWVTGFMLLGIAGGIDFYKWEYDYGHNLNPHAAIKVPGMTYQPPLWGSEQLLNFRADSHPAPGGYIIIASGLISLGEFFLLMYDDRHHKTKISKHYSYATVLLLPVLFLQSCSTDPVPLNYGHDVCTFCKMELVNKHFGSELVTRKGRVYKFDSNECMINYLEEHPTISAEVKLVLTTDYLDPGKLVNARQCYFLRSRELPSPMGKFLTAYATENDLKIAEAKHPGQAMNWDEVQQYVKNSKGMAMDSVSN